MNLKFLPQDKKQQVLVIVLITVLLAIFILSYFAFWRSDTSGQVILPPTANQNINQELRLEKVIERIDFDSDFLKTTRFQDLEDYGNWPLEIEDKGRTNPFLPYNR